MKYLKNIWKFITLEELSILDFIFVTLGVSIGGSIYDYFYVAPHEFTIVNSFDFEGESAHILENKVKTRCIGGIEMSMKKE